jgi:hypothetical protein
VALRTKTKQDEIRSTAEDVLSTVQPIAEAAVEKIEAATEQVVAVVGPALEEAADRVKPAVEDAKDRLTPLVVEAKDKLAPLAQQAVVEGKARGRRTAEKMGIVEEPKKSHKLRNLLIVLGIAGLAAFVYKKVTGKDADPAWTETRDNAAARPPAHVADPAASGLAEGVAAAGPVDGSETAPTAPLASEETVESPTPTTPDNPLKEKNV